MALGRAGYDVALAHTAEDGLSLLPGLESAHASLTTEAVLSALHAEFLKLVRPH